MALQIRHRNSVDIDLFGSSELKTEEFIEVLSEFGNVIVLKKSSNIFISSVNDIKVDFVSYKYSLLEEPSSVDEIRMVSRKDIAAMKLNAIAGRGSKKDFIDLFFLLNEFLF